MKKLTLALLLACMGLAAGCVVVPLGARYDREVYVSPQAPTTYPAYTYRYYSY